MPARWCSPPTEIMSRLPMLAAIRSASSTRARSNSWRRFARGKIPGDLFGAQPNALAFDSSGKKLYVCNGTQNAVGVIQFQPGESKLLGLVPVGWFPGAVVYDQRRRTICVANIKGLSHGRIAAIEWRGRSSTPRQWHGSLSLVPAPSAPAIGGIHQRRWQTCVTRCWPRLDLPRGRPTAASSARTGGRAQRLPTCHLYHQGEPHLRPGARRRERRRWRSFPLRLRRKHHAQSTQARA